MEIVELQKVVSFLENIRLMSTTINKCFNGWYDFVGPRPDVRGYADILEGKDREILSIRPGITGPATLKYRDEERLLSKVENPKEYNDTIIWPDKVRINREYMENWSLKSDIKYIWETIFG